MQCRNSVGLESLAQEEARMPGRMLGSLSRYQAGRQGPSLPPCDRDQTQSVRPVVTHRTGRPRAVSEGYSQETDTGTGSDTLYM